MGDISESRGTSRFTSLDGLRGLSALVVLIHHCLLVSPLLAAAVNTDGTGTLEPWVWWVTFTPLHLLWGGHEAVYVFFILSGFVLTLPFTGPAQPNWKAYFPRRLIRIYLPVWVSLCIALVTVWVVPRISSPELSSWVNSHDEVHDPLGDAFLLGGTGALNSPLWSLQWEMTFSLLLPLYVVAGRRFRRWWPLAAAMLVVVIAAGNVMYLAVPVYMPMFGVGVLMAWGREDLHRWAARLRNAQWFGLMTLAGILLCAQWISYHSQIYIALATVGGSLLVFAFVAWPPTIRLGNSPVLRWLGGRSFSLYLIHEPVVLAITFGMKSSDVLLVAMFGIPVSLLAAELFFRLVEQPSQKLAFLGGKLSESVCHRVRHIVWRGASQRPRQSVL